MTVLDRLRTQGEINGSRTALRFRDQTWNYAFFWRRIELVAAELSADGVRRGHVLGILGTNSPDYLACYFGALLTGAVIVPLNTRSLTAELEVQLATVGATGVIVLPQGSDAVRGISASLQIFDGDHLGYDPHVAHLPYVPHEAPPVAADIAVCVLTTGTTGAPKGVLHSHGGLLHAAQQVAGELPLHSDDISIAFLPFYASVPEHALPVLLAGAGLQIFGEFDVDEVGAACDSATTLHAVPSIVGRLLADGDVAQFRKLRWMSFASEPMPIPILERWWNEVPGVPAWQFYGMSEVLPVTIASADLLKEDPGSVGVAYPTSTVHVVDADLQGVAAGVEGEVVCSSPAQMIGYYRADDLTAAALTSSGAIRTGDLGTFDERGHLHLTGRLKDLIISGGLNIAPAEIEMIALRHPSVAAAAVVGVPHERWGETPVLIAAALPGIGLSEQDLLDHCRRHLAGYKRPTAVAVIEQLPLVGIGKADKAALRRLLANGSLRLTHHEHQSSPTEALPHG